MEVQSFTFLYSELISDETSNEELILAIQQAIEDEE